MTGQAKDEEEDLVVLGWGDISHNIGPKTVGPTCPLP